jgi:hypothetical protein
MRSILIPLAISLTLAIPGLTGLSVNRTVTNLVWTDLAFPGILLRT